MTTKNISRHCQMSLGDKIALVENHCDRRQIRYRGGGQFGFFSLLFFFFSVRNQIVEKCAFVFEEAREEYRGHEGRPARIGSTPYSRVRKQYYKSIDSVKVMCKLNGTAVKTWPETFWHFKNVKSKVSIEK